MYDSESAGGRAHGEGEVAPAAHVSPLAEPERAAGNRLPGLKGSRGIRAEAARLVNTMQQCRATYMSTFLNSHHVKRKSERPHACTRATQVGHNASSLEIRPFSRASAGKAFMHSKALSPCKWRLRAMIFEPSASTSLPQA